MSAHSNLWRKIHFMFISELLSKDPGDEAGVTQETISEEDIKQLEAKLERLKARAAKNRMMCESSVSSNSSESVEADLEIINNGSGLELEVKE